MKNQLRRLFAFILNPLERGEQPYKCQPYSRKILLFVSAVFGILAILVLVMRPEDSGWDALLPVVVFGPGSLYGLIVGLLGTDRAIAKIWGNR